MESYSERKEHCSRFRGTTRFGARKPRSSRAVSHGTTTTNEGTNGSRGDCRRATSKMANSVAAADKLGKWRRRAAGYRSRSLANQTSPSPRRAAAHAREESAKMPQTFLHD